MAMITATLTAGTWYQFTNLDDPAFVQFYMDSSDEVIAAIEALTPSNSSAGFLCVAGMNSFVIPVGKACWVKLTSGSASVTYSQYDGINIDLALCAYARTDGISIDEVVSNILPIVGFDDRPADQITYIGLLHTESAGFANTATVDAATIALQFGSFRAGRTIRIYGIEAAASITSGLTDYASLASGVTLTTAFEDVVIDGTGSATVDLTTILQELIDDTPSWATTSPIQLWIADIGSSASGLNETTTILATGRVSAVYVRIPAVPP